MVWIVKIDDKSSSDGTIVYQDMHTTWDYVGLNISLEEQKKIEQKRKQKAIDRIAWEAERQQRYQKGGHFK